MYSARSRPTVSIPFDSLLYYQHALIEQSLFNCKPFSYTRVYNVFVCERRLIRSKCCSILQLRVFENEQTLFSSSSGKYSYSPDRCTFFCSIPFTNIFDASVYIYRLFTLKIRCTSLFPFNSPKQRVDNVTANLR